MKIKNILMATLLTSGMKAYSAELPLIEGLMMTQQFERACEHLHTVISAQKTNDQDMHVYACMAALNHMILKKPQDATIFIALANDFERTIPDLPLENRYLHFLARNAHTPNQTEFNRQMTQMMEEKSRLPEESKGEFSKKTKQFLHICMDRIENLDNAFVYFAACPDRCVESARLLMEQQQYLDAWDLFKKRIEISVGFATETKRTPITNLLQEHRSSLFQSYITCAFDEEDYNTASVLLKMLLVPGERHSSARLGGLVFYATNDIQELKSWVNKIILERSNPTENTLPYETWLDQAFCVFTAHHLYQHLGLKKDKIDLFYGKIVENLNELDRLTWLDYYQSFILRVERLNHKKALLAQKAQEELLNEMSSLSVSTKSASSGKTTKRKERVRKQKEPEQPVLKTVSPEEIERSRLANIAHQKAQNEKALEKARQKELARQNDLAKQAQAVRNKAEKEERKAQEKLRIAQKEAQRTQEEERLVRIENEKKSLPELKFEVASDKKSVTLETGLWIPVFKYKQVQSLCNPSSFPLNGLGFVYEKDGVRIFYPLPH